jgi:hypothetical protein
MDKQNRMDDRRGTVRGKKNRMRSIDSAFRPDANMILLDSRPMHFQFFNDNHNERFHIPLFKNATLACEMNETLCLNGEFYFTVFKANQCN